MHSTTRRILPVLAGAVLLIPAARGAVILSNLSETDHLSSTVDNNFAVAESFVAGSDVQLDAINLQVSIDPPSAGLTLKIYADNGGSPAATSLADLQLDIGARFTPVAPFSLSTGVTYWVVATAVQPLVDWDGTSSINQTGSSGWSIGDDHREKGFGGPWTIVSDSLKLSVEASVAVPEPGSAVIAAGVGLLGWAGWRRSRCAR